MSWRTVAAALALALIMTTLPLLPGTITPLNALTSRQGESSSEDECVQTALSTGESGWAEVEGPEFDLTDAFTLECWFRNYDRSNNWEPLLIKIYYDDQAVDPWNTYGLFHTEIDDVEILTQTLTWPGGDGGDNTLHLNNHVVPNNTAVTGINQWYHGAATWDASKGEVCLFINSAPKGCHSVRAESISKNSLPLNIGRGSPLDDANTFNGLIDEIRVWSKALTADEIAANLNAQPAAPQAGLVAVWNFNDGEGKDSSGNDHHLTLKGTSSIQESTAPVSCVPNSNAFPTEYLAVGAGIVVVGAGLLFLKSSSSNNHGRYDIPNHTGGSNPPPLPHPSHRAQEPSRPAPPRPLSDIDDESDYLGSEASSVSRFTDMDRSIVPPSQDVEDAFRQAYSSSNSESVSSAGPRSRSRLRSRKGSKSSKGGSSRSRSKSRSRKGSKSSKGSRGRAAVSHITIPAVNPEGPLGGSGDTTKPSGRDAYVKSMETKLINPQSRNPNEVHPEVAEANANARKLQ